MKKIPNDSRKIPKNPLLDFFAITIGFSSFFHFEFIGDFYPSEILAALVAIMLWRKKSYLLKEPMASKIIIFFCLWIINQIVTDIIRLTPTEDFLRGWAAILVLFFNFLGIYFLLAYNLRRIYIFLFFYCIGFILMPLIQPTNYSIDQPWKFGYGPPLILLVFTFVSYKTQEHLKLSTRWCVVLAILGCFSIYSNARSLGAFVILVAFLIWIRNTSIGTNLTNQFTPTRLAILGLLITLLSVGIYKTYEYTATHGILGEYSKMKHEMQTGGQFGILLGGRTEIIPALYAVKDAPIIGHGSWAKGEKYRLLLYKLLEFGYNTNKEQLRYEISHSNLLPVHSTILQGWVWAGIFGFLFWIIIFQLILTSLKITYLYPNPLLPLILFIGLNSLWDIFLSPNGSVMRIKWALNFSLFLISIHLSKTSHNYRL